MTGTTERDHASDDTIHQYVAGTLPQNEQRAFEQHLLACASCQSAVREAVAIRAVLRERAPEALASRRRAPILRQTRWVLPLAAAAALLLFLPLRDSSRIRELGRVDEVAPFNGLPVRASNNDIDRRVDSAMALFNAREFDRAHALLRDVADQQPEPGVLFYLGAAAIASRNPNGAIEPLRQVAAQGGSPYADEARYLIAKAWLQLGAADSAFQYLAGVENAKSRALLDSLKTVQR